MVTGRRRWALGIVCTSALVVSIDNLVLNVALPTLVRELHASTSDLQWIVDAYILVFAGLLLVGGSLGDRFGRARILRVGLVIFGLASLAGAWSSSVTGLVISRGVMGIGSALILPASVAIVTNVFTDPRERGRALGIWSAAGGIGVAIGPVLGGLLLSQFWWGSVFLVNVPIVTASLVIGWLVIPESKNPDQSQFDPLGVVLSTVGVSGLVWATIQAPHHGWGSVTTLASFGAAVAVIAAFVVWELRCAHPMLQLSFLRNPRFSSANLAVGIANFAWGGSLFVLTQLLQSVLGYTPLGAGNRLIPLAAMATIGALLAPRFAERVGVKSAAVTALAISVGGLFALAVVDERSGYGVILVATLLVGFGYGFVIPPINNAVMGAVPRARSGMASGMLTTVKQVSTALGVGVFGSLLVSGYDSELASRTRGLDLSASARSSADSSVTAALATARDLGGETGRALRDAARGSYINGMRWGVLAGIVMLAFAAVVALRYLGAGHEAEGEIEDAEEAALTVELLLE